MKSNDEPRSIGGGTIVGNGFTLSGGGTIRNGFTMVHTTSTFRLPSAKDTAEIQEKMALLKASRTADPRQVAELKAAYDDLPPPFDDPPPLRYRSPTLTIRMNKASYILYGHTWGEAWCSFDDGQKITVKSIELTITVVTDEAVRRCDNCDQVSAELSGLYIAFAATYRAKAVWEGPNGDVTITHSASI